LYPPHPPQLFDSLRTKLQPVFDGGQKKELQDKYKYDKDLCVLPFMFALIETSGEVTPCCPIFTNNYSFGNIFEKSIEEIWYSNEAMKFRESIVNKTYKYCDLNTCVKVKESEESFNSKFDSAGKLKLPDIINFTHDRTCNVCCIMCRDKMYVDDKNTIARLNNMVETNLLPAIKEARYVEICGSGELFASEHLKFLVKQICSKNPNIIFTILTNGLLCTYENINLLGLLDKIYEVRVSLHAVTEDTYNKIVMRSNFEKVMKNVRMLSELKKEGKIQRIQLIFVVSAINYKEMKQFAKMCIDLEAEANFWEYKKWGASIDKEYGDLAIFEPNHPNHQDMIKMLDDPVFDSPYCVLHPVIKRLRKTDFVKTKKPKLLEGLNLPLEIMQNCKLLPNRDSALSLLPKGGIMAEVGVAYGDFSRRIIDVMNPDKFYAIDLFSFGPGKEIWGRTDFTDSNLGQKEFIEKKFAAEIENGQFILKKGFSWNELATFDDNYFDYVYLDAAHDYNSVKKDIMVLLKKIKNNGIIQFNDYTIYNWHRGVSYGVVRAVDELLVNNKHEIIFFCLHPGGFNDIVVKIKK
jgi:radical SAM protein with 4Fe4S-binding SPASM domain